MTKEQALHYSRLFAGIAEGKEIQRRNIDLRCEMDWSDVDGFSIIGNKFEYRLKPEPRTFWLYRSKWSNDDFRQLSGTVLGNPDDYEIIETLEVIK